MRCMHGLMLLALAAVVLPCSGARAVDGASLLESVSRGQTFRALRESSSKEDLTENRDNRPIEPGETLVLGEMEGPGIITHIWTTINARDPFYGKSLVLRIYWDDSEAPSVEVPFGDFFGVGHGAEAGFTSAPIVCAARGRARTAFWRMPFAKRARVTITNESDTHRVDSFYYYLDWERHETLPADSLYFHARYRQETPAKPGNYVILDVTGRGQYVGTVYSVLQAETGWFGEGDDFFYVDGEAYPSLRGTGTEDYFGDAWGFREFATPMFGVPLYDGVFPGDRVTAYRWHLPNPVPFRESLRLEIEHKGSIFTDDAAFLGQFFERYDWISSVAFWYHEKPIAAGDPLPPVNERTPPYAIIWPDKLNVDADPLLVLQQTPTSISYLPQKEEARISVTFAVEKAGRYQVSGMFEHNVLGGVYEVFLDGSSVGKTLNLQNETTGSDWVMLDLHDLAEGEHTLRFEGRPLPPGQRTRMPRIHGFGLRNLVLLRLEDLDGYQQGLKEAASQAAAQ